MQGRGRVTPLWVPHRGPRMNFFVLLSCFPGDPEPPTQRKQQMPTGKTTFTSGGSDFTTEEEGFIGKLVSKAE